MAKHGLVLGESEAALQAGPGEVAAEARTGEGAAVDLERDAADRPLGGLVEGDADAPLLQAPDEDRERRFALAALLKGCAELGLEVLLALVLDAVDLLLAERGLGISWRRSRELVELFDLAAKGHAACPVVGIGDDPAVVGDAGGDYVNVVVLAVGVPVDDKRDIGIAQPVEIVRSSSKPLSVLQSLPGRETEGGMEDRF
jgi:hypothetical protein